VSHIQESRLILILRTLTMKKKSLEHEIDKLNQAINRLHGKMIKLQDYARPYSEQLSQPEGDGAPGQLLKNNFFFLERVAFAVASAQDEESRLERNKASFVAEHKQVTKQMEGLDELLVKTRLQRATIRDEVDELEQMDASNARRAINDES
jgi:chromosome segregation ATPase